MILFIDTTRGDRVIIRLKQGSRLLAESNFSAPMKQAELLLPALERLLKNNKLSLSNIKQIKVANQSVKVKAEGVVSPTSFTALRIGVVTANALAYALGVPVTGASGQSRSGKKFRAVAPRYSRPASVSQKSKV